MEKTKVGVNVKAGVKAGGFYSNHNRSAGGVKVLAGLKAGGFYQNHNRSAAAVR